MLKECVGRYDPFIRVTPVGAYNDVMLVTVLIGADEGQVVNQVLSKDILVDGAGETACGD